LDNQVKKGEIMKFFFKIPGIVTALLLALAMTGCSGSSDHNGMMPLEFDSDGTDRKIIQSGDQNVTVQETEIALAAVKEIVQQAGGHVERSTASESDAHVYCRIPAQKLEPVMDAVAQLGSEDHRRVSKTDVSDEYLDLDARLKNKYVLRDRFQNLLDRAENVQDVLDIENELNRLQSDIDSMQAQMDALDSSIQFSGLTIDIERETVLGPIGYVVNGVWWAFSKLFVIQ
jgi:hypothetical protein